MKKLFALLLASYLSAPLTIISTEKTPDLSPSETFAFLKPLAHQLTYFQTIPKRPVLFQDTFSYKDPNLTTLAGSLPAGKPLDIIKLSINSDGIPIFTLIDGAMIPASQSLVYDHVIRYQTPVTQTFWLTDQVKVYDSPLDLTPKENPTIKPYQSVTVTEKAQTYRGNYYKVDPHGWLFEEDISDTNQKMQGVKQLLESKYHKAGLSVYLKDLTSQSVVGTNQTQPLYSASITKLPLLYYVQKALDEGKISLTDQFIYKAEVNTFTGAYSPSGSGYLPKKANNKPYTLEELLKATAQHSDNVATNILGYYVANQYDETYHQTIKARLGIDWDMVERQVTAQIAGQMMAALYEQNGIVLDYLSDTAFDNTRIAKHLDVRVAHKIGDAYDFHHDVAIIYTDRPYVLSIFTENISYDEMTAISDDIYAILK